MISPELTSACVALQDAGYVARPCSDGTFTLHVDDPDDLSQVHRICDDYMADVIQHPGSSRLTIRAANPNT